MATAERLVHEGPEVSESIFQTRDRERGRFIDVLAKRCNVEGENPFDVVPLEDLRSRLEEDEELAAEIILLASSDCERLARETKLGYATRDVFRRYLEMFRLMNTSEQKLWTLLWLKHPETSEHLIQTMALADDMTHAFPDVIRQAAEGMNLSRSEVATLLVRGAMLHDLGKLTLPDRILNDRTPRDEARKSRTVRELLVQTAFRNRETNGKEKVARALDTYQIDPEASYPMTLRHQQASERLVQESSGWQQEATSCLCGYHHPRERDESRVPPHLKPLIHLVRLADYHSALTQDRVYRQGLPLEETLSLMAREHRGETDEEVAMTTRWIEAVLQQLPPSQRLRVGSAIVTKVTTASMEVDVSTAAGLDARRQLNRIRDATLTDVQKMTLELAVEETARARARRPQPETPQSRTRLPIHDMRPPSPLPREESNQQKVA